MPQFTENRPNIRLPRPRTLLHTDHAQTRPEPTPRRQIPMVTMAVRVDQVTHTGPPIHRLTDVRIKTGIRATRTTQ